jgi:hypothetical protein
MAVYCGARELSLRFKYSHIFNSLCFLKEGIQRSLFTASKQPGVRRGRGGYSANIEILNVLES